MAGCPSTEDMCSILQTCKINMCVQKLSAVLLGTPTPTSSLLRRQALPKHHRCNNTMKPAANTHQERYVCLCAVSTPDLKASLPRLHNTLHVKVSNNTKNVYTGSASSAGQEERLSYLLGVDGYFSIRSTFLDGLVQLVCPRFKRTS